MHRLFALVTATLFLFATAGCAPLAITPSSAAPAAMTDAAGVSNLVPGRFIVVYANGTIPTTTASNTGSTLTQNLTRFGLAVVQSNPADDATTYARLATQPGIAYVLRDRYITGHQISISPAPPATDADRYYRSPQNWAVIQAGGFGAGTPGGPTNGPWNLTRGADTRIAILDSGVDATHPDIAPNLVFNRSEIDPAALPSPCDDASPQDQAGHGTWTASLAAAAAGPTTGGVIGVAPQASILNIKILERLPATSGADLASRCVNGTTGGLLSWVVQGIDDAIAAKANVISLSLGAIVDLNSGDGAGWKATFDSVTHTANAAGIVIVAAAGNEGLNLSAGTYIELPAQARDVLPVTASTNPACAETTSPSAPCVAGPVTRPYYSNYGARLNAIAGPGGSYPNISDTGTNGFIRGACSTSGCFNLGSQPYVQAMGTSASAPLVAGAAALLHAAHPAWTATQITAALRLSAVTVPGMAEPLLNLPGAISLP